MLRSFLSALVLATLGAAPSHAEPHQFRFEGFGGEVGRMTLNIATDGAHWLDSATDNMPFGFLNGTYVARVDLLHGVGNRIFLADRIAADGDRRLYRLVFSGTTATETEIHPSEDLTEMSDTGRIDRPVTSPLEALVSLFDIGLCGETRAFYDGRRIVEITLSEPETDASGQICSGRYEIIAGPGHGGIVGLKNRPVTLTYDAEGTLRRIATRLLFFRVAAVREE